MERKAHAKLKKILEKKLTEEELEVFYDAIDEAGDEKSVLEDKLENCRALLDDILENQKLYEMLRPMDDYMKKIHALMLDYSTQKNWKY